MYDLTRSWRAALYLTASLMLGVCVGDASAQITSPRGRDAGGSIPLDLLRQQVGTVSAGSTVPQEGPVDPDAYIVGPGDMFSISISTLETFAAVLPVSADGNITLPDAGIVKVAGLSLTEAIDLSMSRLRERFSNVEVAVALSAPRQFYVHVVGAVSAPGRYLVVPVSRVSDALRLAYADTSRAPVGNPDFQPSLRNITVQRREGGQVGADLATYFTTGDTEKNPYLQDGDVISVPAYDAVRQSVSVSGQVPFPGTYDLRPGESLRDLIAVASGVPADELRVSARVSRRVADISADEVVSLADGGGGDFELRARDHVFVLPEESDDGFAHVDGRVRFPGSYPIEHGTTTVGDLVQMAGGLRDDALARGAYLVRPSQAESARIKQLTENRFLGQSGMSQSNALVEYPDLSETLARPSSEALRTMRLSDLDFLNRSYLAQELMLRSRIPLDLESAADVTTLMDGDRLYVPMDDGTVFVFGQVVRPGFVGFRAGGQSGDYVRDAGGLAPEANTVYLMEAGTLRFREGTSHPVRSGDMVFVSRKTDTADSAELQRLVIEEKRFRAETRSRTLSAVLGAISSVATITALIVTLRNN